jgi:hypothetical protein
MGSRSSKVASKAAGAAGRRQYPSSPSIVNAKPTPPSTNTSSSPPPSNTANYPTPSQSSSPIELASSTRSDHVDLDARDPQFGSALRRAGIARRVPQHSASQSQTFPTSSMPPASQQAPGQQIFPSQSPHTNPAVAIVQARERIAKRFDQETDNLGRGSFQGRTLLSAKEIREALRLRDEAGKSVDEIEKQLRLSSGILNKLGTRSMTANA